MTGHTVRSYEDELRRVEGLVARMGGIVERQVQDAVAALLRNDPGSAATVAKGDAEIDDLESEIDAQALRVMALRQPVAVDLRVLVASIRIASDLERAGDYAKNIAKRVAAVAGAAPIRTVGAIAGMGEMVGRMLADVLQAYATRDLDMALAVWRRDEDLDLAYASTFRELLTHMMEDPRTISSFAHLIFIAKNLERIGDHATNIAESVHFLIQGYALRERRPKDDAANFAQAGGGEPSA
jgi:phosphate transport system protein